MLLSPLPTVARNHQKVTSRLYLVLDSVRPHRLESAHGAPVTIIPTAGRT